MEELNLKGLNETIYYHVTKEGLPIYMWKNEKVKSVFMSLSVKYGSVDTKFKVDKDIFEVPNGTAHFLEHLKFNVDENTTAHEKFYKLGGDANAFTTFDYTSYIVFATENKKENLETLLDFVYNTYFTKKLVSKEKGIIVEEANMGSDDAYTTSFFHSLEQIFKRSKYRNLITGNVDDINSITLDDIELVYNTFYHPENMFLCVTGNINPYEVVKIVEDNLSKKDFPEFSKPIVIDEREPKSVNKEYFQEELNLSYPRVKYQIKIPKSKLIDEIYDILNVRTMLNLIFSINFGATSDFKEELMNNELIDNIYYNIDLFGDYLIITITAVTNYPDEVIKRIKEKLVELKISDIDVKRKKNATIANLILDYEDVENVNMKIQDDIINYGKIITNLKEILTNITKEDLEKLISKISLENISVCVFLPKENQNG